MTAGKEAVLYAYGVVEGAGVVECPSKGIDDAPVTVLEHDGVAILTSVLSAQRFGARMWEEHAEDPVWLEEVAREHHGVLHHVAATGDVVPLRMPSVYTSEVSARQMMDRRQQLLREAMQRVRARLEWGVKIYLDPGSAGASGDSTGERPASGRDYLAQRSEQARQREQGRQQRVNAVTQVHESLAEAAADSVSNPPQDSALSGRSE
ncbi:MAG: GvpL/GvpF family gas vesicle protein, partial [Nocardioidaceae bacterium]